MAVKEGIVSRDLRDLLDLPDAEKRLEKAKRDYRKAHARGSRLWAMIRFATMPKGKE